MKTIKVFFESENHAEEVATFTSEHTYIACLNSLEIEAKKRRMFVTESFVDIED